jgi:hypothetical protein
MSPINSLQQLQKSEPNGTTAAALNTSHTASPPGDHHAGQKVPPGFLEALTLVALLTVYGLFLILGTFVHTARLDKDFEQGTFNSREVFVMLTCWTWTNLLILCCLASVIGELGRRVLLGARQAPSVRAALARGFFILLVIMGGQFVILGTPGATAIPVEIIGQDKLYTHICLEHFFRLAAFASLLSLIVALHPDFLRRILGRLEAGFFEAPNNHSETPRAH